MENENLIEAFKKKAKSLGIKVTPQRLAVYKKMLSIGGHPSVEEIYHSLKNEVPGLSLATVYRVLKSLEEMGLVKKAPFIDEKLRYEIAKEDHAHFVCEVCGLIFDVSVNCLAFEDKLLEEWFCKAELKVKSCQLIFFGVCSKCRSLDVSFSDS